MGKAVAERPQSKALRARAESPVWTEQGVFLCRLEMGSGECFVGVTAISNRIQCRLEISAGVGREAGGSASGA